MYKSIGEPAVSSDCAVFVIKFVDANSEPQAEFSFERSLLLSQILYVTQRLLTLVYDGMHNLMSTR